MLRIFRHDLNKYIEQPIPLHHLLKNDGLSQQFGSNCGNSGLVHKIMPHIRLLLVNTSIIA